MFSNATNAIISYFIHVMKHSTMLYATLAKHHFSKRFSKAYSSVSVCIFSTKALYAISVIWETPISGSYSPQTGFPQSLCVKDLCIRSQICTHCRETWKLPFSFHFPNCYQFLILP